MTQAVPQVLTRGFPNQDFILLAGQRSPGRAIVRGANSPRIWDKRKGYGFTGASIVYAGDDLSEPVVEIYLSLAEHFDQWDRFAKLLEKPPTGQRPKALDIVHPILNRSPWLITSVVVTDISGFEQDDTGGWQCEIKLEQFRAPKPILAKPVASTPGANATPTAQDANEVVIQELLAKQKALGGAL